MRLLDLDAVAQALGGEFARCIARQTERFDDRRPEEGIAERVQHQGQGAFRDMMFVVTDRELGDQAADGIENRVKRVSVSRQDHPGGQRSCAFLAEGVETLVDDHSGIGLPGAGPLHGLGDAAVHRIGNRFGERSLKPGSRSEVVKQVGVGSTDFCSHGLQSHGLRSLVEQQLARGRKRGRAAFLWGKASSSY